MTSHHPGKNHCFNPQKAEPKKIRYIHYQNHPRGEQKNNHFKKKNQKPLKTLSKNQLFSQASLCGNLHGLHRLYRLPRLRARLRHVARRCRRLRSGCHGVEARGEAGDRLPKRLQGNENLKGKSLVVTVLGCLSLQPQTKVHN